uniref:MHC class I-like antigen recognition-like domain-containing protein n=1 Tax=Branchiostoma floridae TaxID=7739 RepID=C3ZKI2_BRAFL|eukprot:XP_002591070.1 hypothetical protein BRAFLDRAFT_69375 [Branchiostoma floridae]
MRDYCSLAILLSALVMYAEICLTVDGKLPCFSILGFDKDFLVSCEEMAGQVLLWEPNEPRRRGRPSATLRKLMLEETGLEANELRSVMLDRNEWRHRCHLQEDELN